jgi:hypothetical protein
MPDRLPEKTVHINDPQKRPTKTTDLTGQKINFNIARMSLKTDAKMENSSAAKSHLSSGVRL